MQKNKVQTNPDDRPTRGTEVTEPTKAVTLAATQNTYVGRMKLLNPPEPIKGRKRRTRAK